jgi:hypothetical protein
MSKMIKVSDKTHKTLKIGASNNEVSMRDFIEKLADKNEDGVILDMDKYSVSELIPVFQDMIVKFQKEVKTMSDYDKEWIKVSCINLKNDCNKK